jgi:hypothetical protein
MTYEGLTLVFDAHGDLVIEQRDDGEGVTGQVTIPEWQLDLVHAGIAGAFRRRRALDKEKVEARG